MTLDELKKLAEAATSGQWPTILKLLEMIEVLKEALQQLSCAPFLPMSVEHAVESRLQRVDEIERSLGDK